MSFGWVYILENSSLKHGYLKIGRTVNDPLTRASELSSATGVAIPFSVVYSEPVPDCVQAEYLVHQKLKKYRVNNKREFFQIELVTAQSIVQDICEIVRNESSFCRQCRAKTAEAELEQIKNKLSKYQIKLKYFQQQFSFFSFFRNYINKMFLFMEKPFQKLVPAEADRRIYIWLGLLPVCIVCWIALLFIFRNIAIGLTLTIMLLSALMVIGNSRQ